MHEDNLGRVVLDASHDGVVVDHIVAILGRVGVELQDALAVRSGGGADEGGRGGGGVEVRGKQGRLGALKGVL